MIIKKFSAVIVLLLTVVIFMSVVNADGGGQDGNNACPGLGYQSGQCECFQAEKCAGCPCGSCSGDASCACVSALEESGGTISGTVTVFKTRAKTTGPKSFKDVVVYLEKVGDNNFAAPTKHARMDQKGLTFIPHVLVIQKGTTVDFLNSDNDNHNVYLLDDNTGDQNDLGTWKPGDIRSRRFDKSTSMISLCKLHLEMAAYIVVLENPYFTTCSIDAETQQAAFTIENVPAGKYVLKTWHKKLKLKGGSLEVAVEKGNTAKVELVITKKKYAK